MVSEPLSPLFPLVSSTELILSIYTSPDRPTILRIISGGEAWVPVAQQDGGTAEKPKHTSPQIECNGLHIESDLLVLPHSSMVYSRAKRGRHHKVTLRIPPLPPLLLPL
jgi:hypothetical protein